jgi:hypothetical protein
MSRKMYLPTFLMLLLPFSATAATKTWTGTISDSMCGATHKMVKEHEQKGEVSKTASKAEKDRQCTLECVKAGGKYVLASQGKVFEISNQDFAGLPEHAGHTVKLTGDLNADGKTIQVSEITMPGMSGKTHKETKK